MLTSPDDTFRDKFRTQDSTLSGAVFYRLALPNTLWFIAEVADALLSMTKSENWEQAGAVSIEDATSAASEALMSFQSEVGTVKFGAWATIPDGYLLCDGATYLRTDYPTLYAVLHSAFIVDADHFITPDLVGKVSLGASGAHPVGQSGGEETHTLVSAEVPSHFHTTAPHTHSEITSVPFAWFQAAGPGPQTFIAGIGVTGAAAPSTNNSGGDGSHNNLQPYLALQAIIVAR